MYADISKNLHILSIIRADVSMSQLHKILGAKQQFLCVQK